MTTKAKHCRSRRVCAICGADCSLGAPAGPATTTYPALNSPGVIRCRECQEKYDRARAAFPDAMREALRIVVGITHEGQTEREREIHKIAKDVLAEDPDAGTPARPGPMLEAEADGFVKGLQSGLELMSTFHDDIDLAKEAASAMLLLKRTPEQVKAFDNPIVIEQLNNDFLLYTAAYVRLGDRFAELVSGFMSDALSGAVFKNEPEVKALTHKIKRKARKKGKKGAR